jgi:protein SCO1/2
MKVLRWLWLPFLLVALVLAGCQNGSKGTRDKDKQYDVKAKVVAVDMDKKTVTLDHEDIPGLMKAMEMKFPVENAKMLEGIKPGDEVHGKLKVKSGDNMITELHKR